MSFSLIIFLSAIVAFVVMFVANILLAGRVVYLKARGLGPQGFEMWKVGLWLWPILAIKARGVPDVPLRWMLRVLQFSFVWAIVAMPVAILFSWRA